MLGLVVHVKRTQNTYRGKIGVNPGVSGSHSKHPCLQVSSVFGAVVTKFTCEASIVLIPEIQRVIIIIFLLHVDVNDQTGRPVSHIKEGFPIRVVFLPVKSSEESLPDHMCR